MTEAWAGSNRRAELPPNWARLRQQILSRDNHSCQGRMEHGICGRPATDVDHIQPGQDHRPENLQALCRWHHNRKTSAERSHPRITERRPPEAHPGLL